MPTPSAHSVPEAADQTALTVPKPRITRRGLLITAAVWVLYSIFFAFLLVQYPTVPSYGAALWSSALSSLLVVLYAVPVWYLVIRQMDTVSWFWKIAIHLVIGPVFSFVWFGSYILLINLLSGHPVEDILAWFVDAQWVIFGTFMEYLITFSVLHGIRAVQRLQFRERQAMELLTLAQERELAALKAQINPHFLFNTLNSISAMVSQDPEEARSMIADLADLLRYTLDSSKRDLVPLRDEVRFARAYLALEAHRFSDRLDVRYKVDSAALDVLVPPVVLQPLVENAVKHGISPSEAGGTITLHATVDDERLEVCVEDTGTGLNGWGAPAVSNGIGLTNTSARLERLFGSAATLHTETLEPQGFRVSFSIPLAAKA